MNTLESLTVVNERTVRDDVLAEVGGPDEGRSGVDVNRRKRRM
jgi:hypothetical protein